MRLSKPTCINMGKTACFYLLLLLSAGLELSAAGILFQVDMSNKVAQGAFNPETDFVDLAGTFNDWGGSVNQLSDPDQDLIYEVNLDGFEIGTLIEFKFRINGNWNGSEEFPGGGPNRVYTVQEDFVVVSVLQYPQFSKMDMSTSTKTLMTATPVSLGSSKEAVRPQVLKATQWFNTKTSVALTCNSLVLAPLAAIPS